MAKSTNLSSLINGRNTAKKLAAIIAVVVSARKKYNNEDAEITAPSAHTAAGCIGIKYLSASDKAAMASKELSQILCRVNDLDANVEGVNPSRELTGLIATNPVLTNLEDSLTLELE